MEAFRKSLEKEFNTLNYHFDRTISIEALIDFLKTIDYLYIAPYPNKEKWDIYMNYGFQIILKRAFEKLILDNESIPLHFLNQKNFDYCFNNLKYYGQYRSAQRFYQMAKLNLMKISTISNNYHLAEVDFKAGMADKYEMIIIENHFKLTEKVILKKNQHLNYQSKKIEKQFNKKIYKTTQGLIGYKTNPEIDTYYSQKGYIRLMTTQFYDDFDEKTEFGGIPYKQYLNIIQELMGVSLKHLDACNFLSKNKNVDIFNLLPTCYILDEISDQYANFLNIPIENVNQIFKLLTVTKENIHSYLKTDKTFSPPFIKIGKKHVIRSIKGCLYKPLIFLHKSLQENYPIDYTKAHNKREDKFRKQLYSLFEGERIIKIDREIRIKIKNAGIETDIDGALFDTKTKKLALIQLKWQDSYSTDLNERNSKAENFYNKANEWINKIIRWKELNSQKQILNALGIKNYNEFNECYIFVIGRYNSTFTEKFKDPRATWSSWYQILELSRKTKINLDDPIRELKLGLELESPKDFEIEIPDEEINLYTFKMKLKQLKK